MRSTVDAVLIVLLVTQGQRYHQRRAQTSIQAIRQGDSEVSSDGGVSPGLPVHIPRAEDDSTRDAGISHGRSAPKTAGSRSNRRDTSEASPS